MSPTTRDVKNTRKSDSVAASQRRRASHVITTRHSRPSRP